MVKRNLFRCLAFLCITLSSATLYGKLYNFSWVDEGLAGMQRPDSAQDIQELEWEHNVGLIITLTETPLPDDFFKVSSIRRLHLSIEDFHTPTIEQVEEMVREIDAIHMLGKAAVIHCRAGIGRTGTMLASWFVIKHKYGADKAITHIRKLRPGSIETPEQEQFVREVDQEFNGLRKVTKKWIKNIIQAMQKK